MTVNDYKSILKLTLEEFKKGAPQYADNPSERGKRVCSVGKSTVGTGETDEDAAEEAYKSKCWNYLPDSK